MVFQLSNHSTYLARESHRGAPLILVGWIVIIVCNQGDILIHIGEAYTWTPQLEALIHDNFFRQGAGLWNSSGRADTHTAIERAQPGWRRSVSEAVIRGVSVQCLGAALAYLDGYRSAVLPANLVQALDTCAQRGRVA